MADEQNTATEDVDAPAVLDEGAEAPTDASVNGNSDRGYMTVTEEFEYDTSHADVGALMIKKTTTTRYFGNV